MIVDLSFITYIAPILAFLIVFVVCFAILKASNILGESKFIDSFVSLVIATLFVSMAGLRDFVIKIVPWVAVLIISLFFVFILLKFSGSENFEKGFGIVAVIFLLIVFLVSGYVVFNESLLLFLGEDWVSNILLSSRVIGAGLLIIIAAIVSWILVKE